MTNLDLHLTMSVYTTTACTAICCLHEADSGFETAQLQTLLTESLYHGLFLGLHDNSLRP